MDPPGARVGVGLRPSQPVPALLPVGVSRAPLRSSPRAFVRSAEAGHGPAGSQRGSRHPRAGERPAPTHGPLSEAARCARRQGSGSR
jgi:hypothetical protein